jgi:protease IV
VNVKKILKWIVIGWVGLWSVILLAMIVALLLREPVPEQSILVVRLDGQLTESPQPSLAQLLSDEPALTLPGLTSALRAAAIDERIVGVILEVKNPELSLAQIEELEQAMAVVRASGKWSAAHLETAGEFARGDGAYALAATAGEVILAPSGDINLAGLRAEVPFLRGALEKLDIEPYFDKRAAYKNAPDMFTQTSFTKEHSESLRALADDLQATLVAHMAARREVEPKVVLEWIKNGPHSSASAKEQGIVDAVGYWDAVVHTAEEKAGRDDPFVEAAVYGQNLEQPSGGPKLAVIYGEGPITRGEGGRGFGTSEAAMGSDVITQAFRDAREAEVAGILFRVDSPGGSYVASDLIRREVELCREAKIPVIVSMGTVAASGGYFVAMDADRIIADPGTITGSIGVYAGTFATRRFLQNLGISIGVYETVPESNAVQGLDPPDAREKQARGVVLDRIYEDFVQKAAAGRKKTRDEIHAVAQGRVWTGRQALAHGLVDELGSMHVALARLKEMIGSTAETPATIVEFPEAETPLAVLRRLFGAQAGVRLPRALAQLRGAFEELVQDPADRVLALPFSISTH